MSVLNFNDLVGQEAVHTRRNDASAGRESFRDPERICVARADLYQISDGHVRDGELEKELIASTAKGVQNI